MVVIADDGGRLQSHSVRVDYSIGALIQIHQAFDVGSE